MGMLDVFSALFVLAAFATLVCDRDDVRARMARVVAEGRVGDSPLGPRLGVRWWRLATGVLLGLGCAVKWSGIYWLAAFAVLIGGLGRSPPGAPPGVAAAVEGHAAARRAAVGVGARAACRCSSTSRTGAVWFGSETGHRPLRRGDRARTPWPSRARCAASPGTTAARCWTSTQGSPRSRRARTRGSPSRGRGRWGCGRCSTTTPGRRGHRLRRRPTASAPSC